MDWWMDEWVDEWMGGWGDGNGEVPPCGSRGNALFTRRGVSWWLNGEHLHNGKLNGGWELLYYGEHLHKGELVAEWCALAR